MPRDLDWLLDTFVARNPDVRSAVVASSSGLRLATAGIDRDAADHLAAVTSVVLSLGTQIGKQIGHGAPTASVTISFADTRAALVPLGETGGLCVTVDHAADMRKLGLAIADLVGTAEPLALTSANGTRP